MEELTLDSISSIKLYQHKRGYRFSLDAVLLANFVKLPVTSKWVTDLGAGTGVIGLLIAKKYPRTGVKLVEIQKKLFELCKKNISLNALHNRVMAIEADIRKITTGKYHELQPGSMDAIVANPPFRKPGTGKTSPYNERALARHEIMLTLDSLLDTSSYLLKNRGRFFVIYHPFRLSELISKMGSRALEPKRMRFVHPDKLKEANMVMIEAVKGGGTELKIEQPLFVYNDRGEYTEEVKRILSQ